MNPNHGSIALHETLVENTTTACALDVHVFGASGFTAQGSTLRNSGSGPAVCVSADVADASLVIRDSIAQSDEGSDSDVVQAGPAPIEVAATIYSTITGTLASTSTGNLPGPAVFEQGDDQLLASRLADVAQPARDSATSNPQALLDILGEPRVFGEGPDRGAFERGSACDRIFGDGFGYASCVNARRGHSAHARTHCVVSLEDC
jgi:hypothetical protein